MRRLARSKFDTELILEGSWGSRDIGKHKSTMTLWEERGPVYSIEWKVPDLGRTEHIGLTFERGRLVDYDGVFSLPREAIALIRKAGFTVPRDMI